MNSNTEFKDFGVSLAREAAEIMRAHFSIGATKKEIKDDHSPVTIADTAVNTLVIQRITAAYSTHSVLGEEESHGDHSNAEFTWVVDPIDGTRPYSRGIPTSVFSLALTHDGQPVVAVVYDPWTDRMYTAVKGEGAFMNDKQIHVADASTINEQTHYSFAAFRKPWKFPLMESFEEPGAHFLFTGSFVGESMLVATGQIEFAIFSSTTAHDVATAKLIIEEAGGVVTDLDGNDQRYDQPVNGLIASVPGLHATVVDELASVRNAHVAS